MSDSLDSLVVGLFEAGAIRFDGPFTLKSGVCSPYYLDLRVIISRPTLLQQVSDAMYEILRQAAKPYDLVCGVPYTALPIATALSLKHGTPMLMKRKEVCNTIAIHLLLTHSALKFEHQHKIYIYFFLFTKKTASILVRSNFFIRARNHLHMIALEMKLLRCFLIV